MSYFLKFKSQLRRTRPDIVRNLDETLSRAIKDAGGKITGDRFIISAVFNEDKIGFWLDMYILIENFKKNIDTSREFFGYSLVISSKLPHSPEMLCRFLANHSGVFFNEKCVKNFIPYGIFEKPSEWLKGRKKSKYGCSSFYRINELKSFKKTSKVDFELQSEIERIFKQEEGKNRLILTPVYSQIRTNLYDYCKQLNEDFPPLTICFGSIGLGALVDVWSLGIRALAGGELPFRDSGKNGSEEIDNLWELLFRERIRDEVSDYIIRCIRRFLTLIFKFYFNTANKKNKIPVLVLENVHLAGNKVNEILLGTLAAIEYENKNNLLILGTGVDDILPEKLKSWESVFEKVIKIEYKQKQIFFPRLSCELWEIVYAVSVFDRYFSPELFQRLFEENDIDPVMMTRAFNILYNLGLINNVREPRPVNKYLEEYSKRMLDERPVRVNKLVCSRLLSWAVRRNINPCFRLLTIIAELGGVKLIDDLLLLKSLSYDIINDTMSGIETAMNNGQFDELVNEKATAIRYIFYTSKALLAGREEDIEKAFNEIPSEYLNNGFDSYPVFKTQILVNLGAYYLGRHNMKESAEKAKEAILLGQGRNLFCLSQAYRIFSLVCLSKKQTVESIEYLAFALSNAERTDNYNELAISSYYAAAVQFLYGDVFNAAKLANKSIEHSLGAGRCEWADRSRFLEGRIKFELGRYSEALEIFENLRREPFGNKTDEKTSLLSAWIYRCKVYFQDPQTPKPFPANHDADLFEIEAAFLSGNYAKAVELSNSLENPFTKENFLYTEQADWRSGFVQCEHLYFTHGEIQDRMVTLYHSLSLSRLHGQRDSAGYGEEALQGIQKILRDEKLCEMDPLDAFYFFAKFRILEQTKASLVDKSTAVSMAFKRLQRRAGRIEDIETCRQYLNGPRWNHELSLTAREFKLI